MYLFGYFDYIITNFENLIFPSSSNKKNRYIIKYNLNCIQNGQSLRAQSRERAPILVEGRQIELKKAATVHRLILHLQKRRSLKHRVFHGGRASVLAPGNIKRWWRHFLEPWRSELGQAGKLLNQTPEVNWVDFVNPGPSGWQWCNRRLLPRLRHRLPNTMNIVIIIRISRKFPLHNLMLRLVIFFSQEAGRRGRG